MHLAPKVLHNHCFQFLLSITFIPTEIEHNGYAKFFLGGGGGAVNKVHYGLLENGELLDFFTTFLVLRLIYNFCVICFSL